MLSSLLPFSIFMSNFIVISFSLDSASGWNEKCYASSDFFLEGFYNRSLVYSLFDEMGYFLESVIIG